MKDREFIIEDAYQIFVLFMQHFWWNHLRHIMIKKGLIIQGLTPEEIEKASPEDQAKSRLFRANDFVFNAVPGDPGGCGDYLMPLIKERLDILENEINQTLKINEKQLFQLIIYFCSHFNQKFGSPKSYPKNAISFAIEWLEDMRRHPEEHKKEWDMWNECVHDVIVDGYKSSASFAD